MSTWLPATWCLHERNDCLDLVEREDRFFPQHINICNSTVFNVFHAISEFVKGNVEPSQFHRVMVSYVSKQNKFFFFHVEYGVTNVALFYMVIDLFHIYSIVRVIVL